MRFAVCLHGAGVALAGVHLHRTDLRAIGIGLSLGAEVVAVEAVGERGSAPMAVNEALAAGAHRALRVVDPALSAADADATGFALATALDALKIDLVLFGKDADPEGLGDVPSSIAHYMTALYVTDVVNMSRSESSTAEPSTVEVTIRGGGWLRRVDLPLNAVVGIASGPQPPMPRPRPLAPSDADADADAATDPGTGPTLVQVLTLPDLKIAPELVRRRDDRRGAIVSALRPLVTLQSAAAVGALLHKT